MASHVTEETVKRERCIKKKRCVVPWYNPEQFLKVYECLYSEELTKKRWAVDQMTVWDSRCHPSLPTAIEASLTLSRAIIQDALFTNETSLCHEREIQMLYSMALVRFVNLSIELHQGNEKQNIAHIARGLGIPTWIVDLRNEATHSMTPSLPVLRIGANTAMKYLEETFWSIESKSIKNIVKEPVDIQKFKELILHYQVIQFKLFRHRNAESEQYQSDKKEILHTLSELVQCLNQHRQKFLEVLVMDGFFITAEEDLKFLLTDKEMSDFGAMNSERGSDSDEENESYTLPVLPSTLEKFWQPLLRKLNDFGAIPEFVEALLSTQGQRNENGQKLIASWVIRILRFSMNPYLEKNALTQMFLNKGPLFNWDRLMYAAVSNPCIYTLFIFPLIVCHLDLEEGYLRSIMNLMAIAQGQAVDLEYDSLKDHTAFTLDNLKQDLNIQDLKLKRKREGKEKRNVWSVAPDSIDFKNLPVGAVFQSSEEEEGPMIESIYQMYYTNEVKYMWTLELNKNDTEDMEEIVTVEQDTFEEEEEEDEQFLQRKYAYLYKKKTS